MSTNWHAEVSRWESKVREYQMKLDEARRDGKQFLIDDYKKKIDYANEMAQNAKDLT